MGMAENISIPVNVGVVLDLDSDLDGKIALSCIEMALSDFYATHGDYRTRLVLNTRDSMKDVVGAAAAALDLIKNVEVQAILGPTTSMQASFVIDLGEKAQVPIISFSASSPSLTSIRSTYFVRATLNDSTQVNAISELVKTYKWREAVPIYMDNEYGEGIIPYLIDALQAVDARVPYRSVISPSATDDQIVAELYKLMTMQTRVFIVHMYGSLGTRLFAKAKEIGMMSEGYVWIMTDGLTADLLSSPNPSVTGTMQGVLGVKSYVPSTKEVQDFRVRWKRKFQQDNPYIIDAELNIYGLRGYDAATALALAVEKTGTTNFGFLKANGSSTSSTDLASLGVSFNGPSLLQALSNTSFKGLTGNYHFVDGQLQSPAFQIVNVNGNGGREIGFWTPKKGLVKQLVPSNGMNSTSVSGISTVIFPGDTTDAPKGWGIPTKEKKLRIGVPVKSSFKQFVDVKNNPSSNTTKITGFCIDVFDTAVKALPYDLPYEYVPFAKPDGESAGTYNDLVNQVYLKNFDAVVGDVTIVYTRSLYDDYTLPFMESGVSVIVPIESRTTENAWFFLKPLTWDLWASTLLFFVFFGFVVWVLEHRINGDFRGPASHQAGTIFWFSFSTMVFAQRMGFDKSKLIAYNSPEECYELFSKGSGNGGIAAAFDEIPYIRLLMPKYRSKYTVIDLSFKMGGFGFVFPKGSPDVSNISREILNMIEGDKMKDLQDKWFGDQTSPDSGTSVSSNSLSIKTFWGLFLIAGIASLLALIIFIVMFVHQEGRVVLRPSDSTTSIWRKIRHLFSIFNQRDFTSHIEMNGRNGIHFPSSQTPQDVVIFADQLTNPNLEVPVKENQKSNVNHQTPTHTDQRFNAVIHQRSKSY
ncbi:GLUTAMATE RECEPTOR 2.9 [Salix koriyanagi]|uniref:Glutamate receptor n=1 Tax=Salix koriyanagi TaxID=2511006 RepID=A0A9Q0W1N7_9ROSI|nr:GLUTAMATE RECEPTOR 2.9 [Salix koriyanagi]